MCTKIGWIPVQNFSLVLNFCNKLKQSNKEIIKVLLQPCPLYHPILQKNITINVMGEYLGIDYLSS